MKTLNVSELIVELEKIEDKSKLVLLTHDNGDLSALIYVTEDENSIHLES